MEPDNAFGFVIQNINIWEDPSESYEGDFTELVVPQDWPNKVDEGGGDACGMYLWTIQFWCLPYSSTSYCVTAGGRASGVIHAGNLCNH